ncbi:hypothetical protein [Micromonospora sp. 4G55]|uniref:hypothetical protein n=1 Tax=Micromonospora sp. 4G55 TaxID=2806102 RepID=UPI001A4A3E4A|nr:hypothetical protein [Micromonospora sp. 4G55]MBM0256157.1 hypothetical protein [Micromonospora sp. 4G55]
MRHPTACRALLLLASDAGRCITGTHLLVDGGLLADQMPGLRFMPPYRSSTLPPQAGRISGFTSRSTWSRGTDDRPANR